MVEFRERSVEVGLVEYLSAAEQITIDRHDFDAAPLGVETLVRGSKSHPSENRAEVVHPMGFLDVDVEGLVEVPPGTDVFVPLAGRKRCPPAVVDTHHIRRRRRDFAPIVRNENTGDYRPSARVGRPFAGEVTGVELRIRGVDIVRIECDDRRDPLIGIDLDYV